MLYLVTLLYIFAQLQDRSGTILPNTEGERFKEESTTESSNKSQNGTTIHLYLLGRGRLDYYILVPNPEN